MTVSTFEIASAADDGCGYKVGGGYPPTGGYVVLDGTAQYAWKGTSEVDCCYFRFDTSSIPDGDTITAATLRLYVTGLGANPDGRNLIGDWYDFGGEPSVEADWAATVGTDAVPGTALSAFTLAEWEEIALSDPDGNINKAGYTGIRLGISGGAGSGDNYAAFAAYEYDTAFSAELVVTHAAAGGGEGAKTMLLLGVG